MTNLFPSDQPTTDAKPTITALRPTKRDPMRYTIHVEGKVVATLHLMNIEELKIEKGQTWDKSLAYAVDGAVGFDKARKAAMHLVTRRMIGSDELADRLRKKEHPQAAIENVIDWLNQKGYLDDLAYARAIVRGQCTRKPAGRRLLEQKLYQKKIPRTLIQQVIDEQEEKHDPKDAATELAQKLNNSSSYTRLEPQKRKQRLYGALARRGFNPDAIRSAMENLAFDGSQDELY